jgi:hypothetical protein
MEKMGKAEMNSPADGSADKIFYSTKITNAKGTFNMLFNSIKRNFVHSV